MNKVIIAEKPSVAKNIADALKIKGRNDGYYEEMDTLLRGLLAIFCNFLMQKITMQGWPNGVWKTSPLSHKIFATK